MLKTISEICAAWWHTCSSERSERAVPFDLNPALAPSLPRPQISSPMDEYVTADMWDNLLLWSYSAMQCDDWGRMLTKGWQGFVCRTMHEVVIGLSRCWIELSASLPLSKERNLWNWQPMPIFVRVRAKSLIEGLSLVVKIYNIQGRRP